MLLLDDLRFQPFISSEVIQRCVKKMAGEISRDLKNDRPLFLGILNGAFIFAADLTRQLPFDCDISFVRLSSYDGTRPGKEVITIIGPEKTVEGRTVVVLEDIVDTGKTMQAFIPALRDLHPDRILTATLLLKPGALEQDLDLNYVGMKVPDDFLVGYGLDYNGLGRNLSDIYRVC